MPEPFHSLSVLTSTLASTIMAWRGTRVLHAATQPAKTLQLFDREGSPACRQVRLALTALGLDVDIFPCPAGGKRYTTQARTRGGTPGQPVLVDNNTRVVHTDAAAAVDYLFETYAHSATPKAYQAGLLQNTLTAASSLARYGKGMRARSSRRPKQLLALWSFESSPYSRLVRERLTELELPYTLHNLGKEQLTDMGPAVMRLRPGPYRPKKGAKRAAVLAKLGRVQLPYLEDPNTQTKLFESAVIMDYLERQYAI